MKTGTMTGILIVALVTLFVGVAAAQYGQGGGARYVDADNDGACDNIGDRPGFVDADGDSVCDNLGDCGRGRGGCGCGGSGMEFVDEDGDGICDNIGTNGRDSDGDGIPNGQEDDYEPPRDGSGNRGQGGRNR